MKSMVALPITLGLCGAGIVHSPAQGKKDAGDREKPNILLLHVDQHRYDCMEMTGRRNTVTPNLARLASEGMTFTDAYTPIPTSCPARQTLLSGLWPELHKGIWNYDITLPVAEFDSPTWTEELAATDYKLGYVGKWHVHATKTPLDFGFADYVPEVDYFKWRDAQNVPAQVDMKDGPLFGGYDPAGKQYAKTHWLARQAIEMIKEYEAEGRPWHIRWDPTEPHLPCFPSKEFYDMYDPAEIEAWENFHEDFDGKPYIQKMQPMNWDLEEYTWEQWSRYMQRYLAMITQVDDAVGIILDALEELGLADNTMVIYTSDHGDAAGSHRMIDKHYVMYEEEVHIPLFVRWPGVVEPGSVCDRFVLQELDLAQTISDIGGVTFQTQGMSLLPLLKEENPGNWREYAFSNYNGQQFGLFVQRMIRDKRWKYVWNMTDTDELYDLQNDPWELNNLAHDPSSAAELARLRKALYEDLKQRKDPLTWQNATKRQLVDGRKL